MAVVLLLPTLTGSKRLRLRLLTRECGCCPAPPSNPLLCSPARPGSPSMQLTHKPATPVPSLSPAPGGQTAPKGMSCRQRQPPGQQRLTRVTACDPAGTASSSSPSIPTCCQPSLTCTCSPPLSPPGIVPGWWRASCVWRAGLCSVPRLSSPESAPNHPQEHNNTMSRDLSTSPPSLMLLKKSLPEAKIQSGPAPTTRVVGSWCLQGTW